MGIDNYRSFSQNCYLARICAYSKTITYTNNNRRFLLISHLGRDKNKTVISRILKEYMYIPKPITTTSI